MESFLSDRRDDAIDIQTSGRALVGSNTARGYRAVTTRALVANAVPLHAFSREASGRQPAVEALFHGKYAYAKGHRPTDCCCAAGNF